MLKKNLQLLAALCAICSAAQADDYASPAAFIPVSGNGNGYHEEFASEPLSCKEARETAWFVRELARTDGDANPEVESVACGGEILAGSTADSD
jgi:hypothetical protein